MSFRSGLTIFSVFTPKGHPGSKLYTEGPQFSENRPISSNSCSRPPGQNHRKPSPYQGQKRRERSAGGSRSAVQFCTPGGKDEADKGLYRFESGGNVLRFDAVEIVDVRLFDN